MAAAMRLIPCTASRREVSGARWMWILDPFLHSTPTPKPHMPKSSKQSPQVQHRQARLHRRNCHPRPEVLWHLSILLQQLIPIYPNIRQQTWMHRGSQCGVNAIPSLTATPAGPALHARTCYRQARAVRLAGVWGKHIRSTETTVHLNRRSAPVLGLRPAPGRKCTPFLCRARCRPLK